MATTPSQTSSYARLHCHFVEHILLFSVASLRQQNYQRALVIILIIKYTLKLNYLLNIRVLLFRLSAMPFVMSLNMHSLPNWPAAGVLLFVPIERYSTRQPAVLLAGHQKKAFKKNELRLEDGLAIQKLLRSVRSMRTEQTTE